MESTASDSPPTTDLPAGELDRLMLMPAPGLAVRVVVLCVMMSLHTPGNRLLGILAPAANPLCPV